MNGNMRKKKMASNICFINKLKKIFCNKLARTKIPTKIGPKNYSWEVKIKFPRTLLQIYQGKQRSNMLIKEESIKKEKPSNKESKIN